MAIPVINTTTSILAYKQWETWEYQPYATNTPTNWSSGLLPTGMTLTAATGKISGAAQKPGIYLVPLTATNASGNSDPLVLTIGIEPAAVAPDAKLDVTVDVDTGEVKLVSYSAQTQQSQSANTTTPAPLLSVKEDDDLLMRIFFLKGGGVIDLNLTSLKFAVKELEFQDRKSTRLNSSHVSISYAVFCLKKKKKNIHLIIYNRATINKSLC